MIKHLICRCGFDWLLSSMRDIGCVQQNMAGPAPQMKTAPEAASSKLSMPQQYARVSGALFACTIPLRALFSLCAPAKAFVPSVPCASHAM